MNKMKEILKISKTRFHSKFKSALYVPSSSEKMLKKSASLKTCILIPDLEDSVAESEKEKALMNLQEHLPFIKSNLINKNTKIFPRVNSFHTKFFKNEINTLLKPNIYHNIDGFHIPKISSIEEIREIDYFLNAFEKDANIPFNSIKIFPNIESAEGIIFLKEILLKIKYRCEVVGFGGDDFAHDLGVTRGKDDFELDFARKSFALTCLAFKMVPVDSPFANFKDPEGLKKELEYLKKIGFKAKFAIHPSQLEIINEFFDEVCGNLDEAKEIVLKYEEAMKKGIGAISLNGKMIDMPIYKKAKEILSKSKIN